MTWKSRYWLVARSLLAAAVLSAAMAGCHHHLQPRCVSYPCPPPVECPSLPLPGVVLPVDRVDDARNEPSAAESLEVEPIDLPTALRLADAQSPEIALSRERINEALAEQDRAELLWIPNLEVGPNWTRHDGQIQRATGEVVTVSRSSAFIGGGPALSVALSDAIFAPLAARQISAARQAGAVAVANEQLLAVAIAYIDLLQVSAELQINEETLENSRVLFKLTESNENAGTGAPADTARSRTEVYRREWQRVDLQGRIAVASSRLVQLLNLPPQIQLRPQEPAIVPIILVPEELPLDELLAEAVANRPELAENRAVIAATVEAWRSARMAPWLPSLRLAYWGGGFGGGPNSFFGDFDGRSDFTASLVWQLQSFGLGNQAVTRERHSQYAQVTFRQASLETRVANELVSAFKLAYARRRELSAAQRAVVAARESYRLNEERIRRAPDRSRPIELLQSLQALSQARQDFLQVVADYNRAQFRLYTAMGNPPLCATDRTVEIPTSESTVPPKTESEEELPPAKPAKGTDSVE